jgi:hypothetical protein
MRLEIASWPRNRPSGSINRLLEEGTHSRRELCETLLWIFLSKHEVQVLSHYTGHVFWRSHCFLLAIKTKVSNLEIN